MEQPQRIGPRPRYALPRRRLRLSGAGGTVRPAVAGPAAAAIGDWIITRAVAWTLASALGLAAGCASLPDASPYLDATLQLRSAVAATGTAVATELDAAAAASTGDDRAALERHAKTFGEEWLARVEAADAMVAYAQSLADLSRAGNEGADAARSLAGALTQLAGGVGLALPAAGAMTPATDAAAFVYAQVAAVRASRSLEEALVAAQPAVNQIAALVGKDLDASLRIVRAAHGVQRLALASTYADETAYLRALDSERRALYAKGRLTREDEKRLREIGEMYDATRAWREPMVAAFAALDRREATERELIAATKVALSEWAAAHRALAAAVRDGRTLRADALVQATLEARELLRRLRAP
jgi:hypothetical protein